MVSAIVFLGCILVPACEYAADEHFINMPSLDMPSSWRAAALPVGMSMMLVAGLLRLAVAAEGKVILSALAVDREAIIEDFDRSNDAYRELVARLNGDIIALGGGEPEMDVVQAFMGVSTKNFRSTLDLIDREFGSMHDYLQNQLFLSKEDIQLLRKRYLL
jgi:hypothetical protein